MATIEVPDYSGDSVTLVKPNNNGRASAANSRPVALSVEDLQALKTNAGQMFQVVDDINTVEALSAYAYNPAADDILVATKAAGGRTVSEILIGTHNEDTTTSATLIATTPIPHRLISESAVSQRGYGSYNMLEMVDLDSTPLTVSADITIASIQQTTTTLTIILSSAWDGSIGDQIHVFGVTDNRLNYANLCIATISLDNKTLTATTANDVALPSLTVGPYTTQGTIRNIDQFAGARNGYGIRFSGVTASAAAILSRFDTPAIRSSGTNIGVQTTTTGSSATTYTGAGNGEVELKASCRFICDADNESFTVSDQAIDSPAIISSRQTYTAVKPAQQKLYHMRFRGINPKSMPRPVAHIISSVKTGTTTATITCYTAHGLVTGNYVTLNGRRDLTNFPNMAAAAVVTRVDDYIFTIVDGGAVTATTYGGAVCLSQGGRLQPGLVPQSAQSVARDAAGNVTLVGSVAWTTLNVGDYVDLMGIYDNTTGADLGFDGVYRVLNLATTTMILGIVVDALGNVRSPTGAVVGTTNCGGCVIQRTAVRNSGITLESYSPVLNRIDGAGTSRIDKSIPSNITTIGGTNIVNGGLIGLLGVGGSSAHSAVTNENPVAIGGRVVGTTIATVDVSLVATDKCWDGATTGGQKIIKTYGTSELDWSSDRNFTPTVWASASTLTQVRPASGTASVRTYVTGLEVATDALGAATDLWLLDGPVAISSATVATPGVITSGTHDFKVGDAIVLQGITSLALTGVSANQIVYVVTVPLATTFTVALTPGGTGVACTVTGTATAYRVLKRLRLQATALPLTHIHFPSPIRTNANVQLSAIASGTTTGVIYINAQGYYGF